jgi:hypothetical protein
VAAYAFVPKACPRHIIGTIDIPQVNYDCLSHLSFQPSKIQRPELRPFRDNDESISAASARIGVTTIFDIGQFLPGLFHASGIVSPYSRAEILQSDNEGQRRRLPHIVSVWLECQTQYANRFTSKVTSKCTRNPSCHGALSGIIDGQN